jgi:hypothetical protein
MTRLHVCRLSQCVSSDTVYTAKIEDATKWLVCGWLRVLLCTASMSCAMTVFARHLCLRYMTAIHRGSVSMLASRNVVDSRCRVSRGDKVTHRDLTRIIVFTYCQLTRMPLKSSEGLFRHFLRGLCGGRRNGTECAMAWLTPHIVVSEAGNFSWSASLRRTPRCFSANQHP